MAKLSWTMVTWRVWLFIVAATYLVMGFFSIWYRGAVLPPAEIWVTLWVPAGAMGVYHSLKNRPPTGTVYLAIPTMLATGSIARGWSLLWVQSIVGAISWFLLTWLLVWGWNKTMAAPAHRAEREG